MTENTYGKSYEIVKDFGRVLEEGPKTMVSHSMPESAFSYSKDEIKVAFRLLLLVEEDPENRRLIENGYMFFNDIISDQLYQELHPFESSLSAAMKSQNIEAAIEIGTPETSNKFQELLKSRKSSGNKLLEEVKSFRKIRSK